MSFPCGLLGHIDFFALLLGARWLRRLAAPAGRRQPPTPASACAYVSVQFVSHALSFLSSF